MIQRVAEPRLGWADMCLLAAFILGIYTSVDLHLTPRLLVPSVVSGISGLILLWRRRDDIAPAHVMALLAVAIVYLGSILTASDMSYLSKRFTGYVQIIYSFVLGYAVFLTSLRAKRSQLAALFIGFCLLILFGALLEDYGGLRPISDAVRERIYNSDVLYDANLRDTMYYGKIRPRVFASEPSAVTFAYTLLAFLWLLVSQARGKLLIYLALMGVGMLAMPGPTLLLMVVLLVPYLVFATKGRISDSTRLLTLVCASVFLGLTFVVLAKSVFATRLAAIVNGQDPSFFFREIGPALIAAHVIATHPIAGAGLTGEQYIADAVVNVYLQSSSFYPGWLIQRIAMEITNYMWLHWIYLGLVWGVVAAIAVTVWLKVLDVPDAVFCWIVWMVMGQASGAYVAPKTWAVLFLTAGCSTLARRRLAAPVAGQTNWGFSPHAFVGTPTPPPRLVR